MTDFLSKAWDLIVEGRCVPYDDLSMVLRDRTGAAGAHDSSGEGEAKSV